MITQQMEGSDNDYDVDQWFNHAGGNTLGMIEFHFTGTRTNSEEEASR
jgi:hypothetical protein